MDPHPPPPATTTSAAAHGAAAGDRLSRLKLVGVKVGRTITQNIASTLLSSRIAATAIAAECTVAATAMTVAQAQLAAEALAVVRVSVANNARMQQVLQLVADYAAKNPSVLADFERMSASNTAALSFKSNVVGSLVAGAIQEAVAVAYYFGSTNADGAELKATTQQVAATTAASLAFSAGGAAVGAVLLPGAGGVLGSLIGGVGGSYVTGVVATQLTAPDPDRQRGFGPPDADTTFAPTTHDEADYVLVLLPSGEGPSCTFTQHHYHHHHQQQQQGANDETDEPLGSSSPPPSQAAFLPAPPEASEAAWNAAIHDVDAGLSELVLLFQCMPEAVDDAEASQVIFASAAAATTTNTATPSSIKNTNATTTTITTVMAPNDDDGFVHVDDSFTP